MKDLTSGVELVPISQLKECPKRVTLHSRGMLDALITAAKSHFDLIPPITAAEVDGTLYIVDGHARVEACRAAGLREIRAIVKRAKDLKEVCMEHVITNRRGVLNPFKLHDALLFLGDRAQELVSLVAIEYIGKIGPLTEQARSVFSEFLESIADRAEAVQVPEYIIIKLAKLQPELQVDALTEMINAINVEKKFYWPTPSMLDALFAYYKKDSPRKPPVFRKMPLELVRGVGKDNNDDGESPTKELEQRLRKVDSGLVEKAKALIGNAPGYGFMHDDSGNIYLVNMRKQSFSPLKETESILSVKDDYGKLSYILPPKYADFLELDIDPSVYVYTLGTVQDLDKFAKGALHRFEEIRKNKGSMKMLVISTEKLW